jgi:N-methylhydantoinase A
LQKSNSRYRFGVDIGGTFTDLVIVDEGGGRMLVGKTLTTPEDPSVGVLTGLAQLLREHGLGSEEIASAVHATTLITNAIIERKGARTGLITTQGFGDVLEIGREMRYDLYDLFLEMPAPLVPRGLRLEVSERIGKDGDVRTPLERGSLERAAEALAEAGVEAVAVCLLHSYINDEHELAAGEYLQERYPGLFVSISSRVAREIREYERASTTVANAYVQPLTQRYLDRLAEGVGEMGFRGSLFMMLSNGGIASLRSAKELPIRLVESGPAAGALVGGFYGGLVGERNVLAFDMGGTTAKACIVDDGRPMTTFSFEAARVHRFRKGSGLPLKVPAIELIEIGAGGGSLARIDKMGLLKVGPESAGAEPGPACYGRGGEQPTVTDADLVLGYLDPDYFLGGEMRLDLEGARRALREKVARPLGIGEVEAAWGIHEIVNENMASATRVYIAEKGRDPRRYSLVATGGAGPVHAYRVARKLQLGRVICPLGAGVASTIGLLVAPPRVDYAHAYVTRLGEVDWDRLGEIYRDMEERAVATLGEVGVPRDQVSLERMADMRYVGQGFEVVATLPGGELGPERAGEMREGFERAYLELYERSLPSVEVEVLNWRLVASGPAAGAEEVAAGLRERAGGGPGGGALKGRRPVYLGGPGRFEDVAVYDRYLLAPGESYPGPAIVEERESTVVIGPEARFSVDEYQNLIIEMEGGH